MSEGDFWGDKKHFEVIFDSSPIGIELCDADGRLIHANKSCLDIFGVAGVDDFKGFGLLEDPNLTGGMKERLRAGETIRYEAPVDFDRLKKQTLHATNKSGIMHVDVFIMPVKESGNGPVSGYIVQVQDITHHKEAESEAITSKRMWKKTFDAVDECIFLVDGENNIMQCNAAFAGMVGGSVRELIGRKCYEIVHNGADAPAFCVAHRAMREGGLIHEVIYEPSLDKYVDVYASVVEAIAGEDPFVVHTMRDITESKETERQLLQMTEELQMSGDNLRKLVESNPNSTVILDREGVVLYANPAALLLLGREKYDIVGEPFAYPQASEDSGEIEIERPDGSARTAEIHASNMNWFGEKARLISLNDITMRKLAEDSVKESEERLRDIFDNTSDLIQSVTPEGKFIYTNRAWRNTLGYSKEDLEDFTVFDIIHPASIDHCRQCFEQVMTGETLKGIEAIFISKDDNYIIVEGNISCRFEGGMPVSTRAIFRDVTERKLAEDELARYAEELTRSNRELENFAHIASHDLQEPLRMVSSYLQLLEKYGEGLDEEAREYIDFAVDGAMRMKAMIDGLLVYSRVGTEGLEFARADCGKALDRAVANLSVAVEESGAVITSDHLPTVMGDEVQLVQLLQNLISNAIKFRSDEAPAIHVSASEEGGEWVFSVQDNGIGIEPEQVERIFSIFQRLHTREEYEGTGIGLAVAKRIVERHRGRIWVESRPGGGSTFFFTVPA